MVGRGKVLREVRKKGEGKEKEVKREEVIE